MFFDDDILLTSEHAKKLYSAVRDLPIIDIHCHLDPEKIADDAEIPDVGRLFLQSDHYKWRAMRMCGVDERYITGDAPYKEKFMKYAEIMPKLFGNPLYYFTHFELKQLFGVTEPLGPESAGRIYDRANEALSGKHVSDILKKYNVKLIATTDDPADSLCFHGVHNGVAVVPAFRPDKYYCPEEKDLQRLGEACGHVIKTLDDMMKALISRLDFFITKGCFMSDHGFGRFPRTAISDREAEELFRNRAELEDVEKEALFGNIISRLMPEYKKRRITAQLHFSVKRNVNSKMFSVTGADSGFDVIGAPEDPEYAAAFFDRLGDGMPNTVLYTLNPASLRSTACLCGAFRGLRMGAAWWFNDTLCGIKENIDVISEYSALGTNDGMLTDSRSFSSYSRFDFFRRIICDKIGGAVTRGEYGEQDSYGLVYDLCYGNTEKTAKNSSLFKNQGISL